MGISGLLPLLKDVSDSIHVSKYKGKALGIDGYVWLHRGAYGCAEALATGKETTRYVDYAMANVNMLLHFGIKPYLVFDGDRLPAKQKTENDRRQRREENLVQAEKFMRMGKRKEAQEFFARCIDVTPTMAFQLIKRLRKANLDYIVAPYEADAQLAYLERRGLIDGIITEDSDLLVFGCKVVLYKMDKEGNCVELLHVNRTKCKGLPMHSFDDALFRQMAILSGCDYLPSIPKMGLKTANQMLRQFGSVARVLSVALAQGMQVPTDYREAFEKAERTFVYQRVFDRSANSGKLRMTTLTSPPNDDEVFGKDDCIGPEIRLELIEGIANGTVDPITKELIGTWEEGEEKPKISRETSSGTSYARSFYSQTRMSSKNNRKNKAKPNTNIPGQGKLDTFFTAKPSNPLNTTSRQPFANKTNQASSHRKDEDKEEFASLKRIRLEESVKTTNAKSKYFTQPALTTASPPSSSPTKVYDGCADLARFAITPTRTRTIRPFSKNDEIEEQQHGEDEDEGNISSPSVTASVEKLKGKERFEVESYDHQDEVLSSSPCNSPSKHASSLHQFNLQIPEKIFPDRNSTSIENLSRFAFKVEESKPQFRSPNEVLSEIASDAHRFAQTTPGSRKLGIFETRNSSGSEGGSRGKITPFASKLTNSFSAKRNSLALNLEHDPFEEEESVDKRSAGFDTPLNAIRKSSIKNRINFDQTPPNTSRTTNGLLFTPNTTKPDSLKRSSSVRRMLMLERDV